MANLADFFQTDTKRCNVEIVVSIDYAIAQVKEGVPANPRCSPTAEHVKL